MQYKKQLFVGALLLSFGFYGCADTTGEEGSGSASVTATVAGLSAAEVTAIQITVSGPNISPDIISDLTQDPGTGEWSGVIENIPAGADRTFVAEAINASAEVVYSGSVTGVTIADGQQVALNLFLQQTTPPDPFVNTAPIFESLVVSSGQAAPGSSVTLTVAVTDPDPGDVLTLLWEATGGAFDATDVATVVWTAPATQGLYLLTVSASDITGATSTLTVSIEVETHFGSGSASLEVDINTWPEVQNLVPDPTRIDVGEVTQLELTAPDADGDPVTFAWSSDCSGDFSDPGAEDPSFTLTADNAGAPCSFTVAIDDGRGGSTSATATISTGPPIVGGGWAGQELLERDDAGDAEQAQVAVDAAGNAVAVWVMSDGDATSVYANRLTSGVWGGPELLATDAGYAPDTAPQVAISPSGDAVVVWRQGWDIYAARLTSGVWSSSEAIVTGGGSNEEPQVAMNPSGDAVAVWQNGWLWAARLTSGVWSSPERIDPGLGGASMPQVAVDPAGDAVVVSMENGGFYANRLTSGVWGSPELLDPNGGYYPQVAVDANGNAVAAWQQSSDIYAIRLTSGVWGNPELLEAGSGGAYRPQLAVNASGDAVVVWYQNAGDQNIYANRLTSGVWGSPELLETDPGYAASFPQVAVDDSGDAVAVWQQWDGSATNIYANRLTSGVWGSPSLLETDSRDALYPQVALGTNGDAVAVWQQWDGTRNNVWTNRF